MYSIQTRRRHKRCNMSYPTDPAGLTCNNVLDGTVFHELMESLSQAEAVAAVYRQFVENAVTFIGDMRDQDAAARIETLHTLKGSAAMLGATRMAELAARLQALGASIQVEVASRQLSGELEKFRAEVASRLLPLGASLDRP
jgi:HPt (histidine-containing phosphotransfer) domain-containing protein